MSARLGRLTFALAISLHVVLLCGVVAAIAQAVTK